MNFKIYTQASNHKNVLINLDTVTAIYPNEQGCNVYTVYTVDGSEHTIIILDDLEGVMEAIAVEQENQRRR
jgi:hypothetical protein